MVRWETLVDNSKKPLSHICGNVLIKWWVVPCDIGGFCFLRVWVVRDYSQACSRTRFSLMLLDMVVWLSQRSACRTR